MKILVLNCGSSSIKYKLFDMDRKEVIAQGGIEKIGLKDSFLKFTLPSGEKKVLEKDIPEHTVGVEFILNTLTSPEYGAIKSLDEINAVGHRMVHGGEKFSESVRLTPEVLAAFTACNDLAPLHNPANLKGVNAVSTFLETPKKGQIPRNCDNTMLLTKIAEININIYSIIVYILIRFLKAVNQRNQISQCDKRTRSKHKDKHTVFFRND